MTFSIITCTYNPNRAIFNRLITSIAQLNLDNIQAEWIIVDNNSKEKIENVFDFFEIEFPICHIVEKKQGLTNARITGINIARAKWVIFFDDDNEPSKNYLLNAKKRIEASPKLMCFGPGKINVEFIGSVNSKWVESKKHYFQEKDEVYNEITIPGWSNSYPQGTGQIVHENILREYVSKVVSGKYSMKDRTGKSLSSGGDVQIVLLAILKSYSVGVDPSLQLNHLIEGKKATFRYIRRLAYGTASSYICAYNQVFTKNQFTLYYSSNRKLLKKIFNHFTFYKYKSFSKNAVIRFCNDVGQIKGPYNVDNKKSEPYILKLLDNILS